MDLITVVLCITVSLVSAIVIYMISVSSMKEKSYDEVKAEQKKKAEEYLAQGRSAKDKAKDKKLKKAGKKVKEKISSESIHLPISEESENVKGHVVFVEPPTIVDEEPVVIEEKKRKKNKKKEKPILINKNEITLIVDAPPPVTNHFEQIVPKDDFSLKRSISREEVEAKPVESVPPQKQPSKSKVQANPPKEPKMEKAQTQKQAQQPQKLTDKTANAPKPHEKPSVKTQEKTQVPPKPVEEVVTKSSTKQVQSAPPVVNVNLSPSIKTNRKKRSELATLQQMSGEKEAVNVNLLMPLVHKAELSRTEIQVLIDLLLNKQQGSSVDSAEWIEGRQDPVVKLKKQLAEKEKVLTAEQEAAAALQSKLRELRTELNAEKHSTRQLEESLQARQAELGSVAARTQHLADEKQGLLQQIQQLQAKLSEEHMMLCKLQEDQGQTQTAMQQELLAQRQQLEMHITRLTEQHQETIAALEVQMGQMATQLQEQEAVKTSLSGELALVRERGAHLQDSAAQSQDLARQVKEIERLMSKSQYDTARLQSEVNSLTEQLALKRAENDKLNSLVTNLQADNNRLTHQLSCSCMEAQQLRDENESLAAQVTASMERPAAEGRENGDVTYTEAKHSDTSADKIHEKELMVEKLKEEILSKEKELNHFKTDLAHQETLMSSLKGDLDVAHSNTEKMLKEISSYKCLVQEQESVISALREEGDSAHQLVNTLRDDVSKSKAELARLSVDCATREQLESRESAIEKLTSELNTHKTKLADQAALIQKLHKEIEQYKASLDDNSREEKLTSELNTYKTELVEKEVEVKSLTTQISSLQADIGQLRSELAASQEAVDKLRQEVKSYQETRAGLTEELELQKRKNDELRSKNWKAMDALSTTEKTLETKVKQSQRLVSEAEEKARLEEQERTKQLLQRVLPHVTVDSKQEYEVWLERFMACAGDHSNSDGSMLAEVEQQNCQLQAMVTHYKAIIADTEGMLNRLQSHVEQEEGRWGQQIQSLNAQLEAVIQERDRLEENSDLAAQLEEALTRNKELNKELTRLKSLVQIGEKSVNEQVKESVQLKEQLDALQAGVKNGLSTMDTGSQTLRKRRSLSGWLRRKLRSTSWTRRSRRSKSSSSLQSA